MIGKTNIAGSSGRIKVFGFLIVKYPEDSLCTCTDGTTILEAKDVSGDWVFEIPYEGTWTTISTDGKRTASKAFIFEEYSTSYSVTLRYNVPIFIDGAFVAPFGGWSGSNGGWGISDGRVRVTGAAGASAEWPNVDSSWWLVSKTNASAKYYFDVTPYSKLVIVGQGNGTDLRFRNTSGTQTYLNSIGRSSGDTTHTFDITNLNGSQMLEIHKITNTWGQLLLDAKEIYFLEKDV